MTTPTRRFLRGWRTIIVNALAILFVAFEMLVPVLGLPEFLAVLPEGWVPYFVLGLALANVVLRLDTRTPPGRGE